jgi:hypothetical protein
MYFNQFSRKLSENKTGVAVARQLRCNGHLIEMTTEQVVTIDGVKTEFYTIAEARDFIKQTYYTDELEQEIAQDIYEQMSDEKVAKIIAEHHDVKVTDTLIESYIELASSKIFTVDPVATQIRDLNKFDKLVEGKVDFKLNDGSVVAINKDTQLHINNLLQNHNEIVEHMRESKENFLSVIQQIRE